MRFPPNDAYYGDNFETWVKTRLRRYIVERCLHGVDINPLAVELARVSLWIATLDPELPFTFLDHKLKVGNSLVGCWLDRVEDYPLKAWEREGGDGKNGESSLRIKARLRGGSPNLRGLTPILQEMKELIETRFLGYQSFLDQADLRPLNVVAKLRQDYQRLHERPIYHPEELEARYREIESSPARQALKQAMNEWCAVWFWPADEQSLAQAPSPHTFHGQDQRTVRVVEDLSAELRFFHWELEFPDVFTPERSGFDALVGNPPWDVMKPNSQEFFTEFDPLYRSYDKQAALRRQRELFESVPSVSDLWDTYNARFKALGNWARNTAEPFDLALARGHEGESLAWLWRKRRSQRAGYAHAEHPFRLQGSADLNSYKMFAEVFWNLLGSGGRLGVILPTGIYSDFGTKDLREVVLQQGQLDLLYAFQNEKRVFTAAHHSFKQTALMATRGGRTESFRARFRMGVGDSPEAHEIPDDLLRNESAAMVFTPDDVRRNSPKSLSLVELRSPRDLAIFRKIYDHSIRIGDNTPAWEITYAREFDMTNDSQLFPPLEQWEEKGYRPDVFGRWIGPNDTIALPFYQGISIHQFDPSYKSWEFGSGRSAAWQTIPHDRKVFRPKFLMSLDSVTANTKCSLNPKLVHRQVARSTDTRSMIASLVVGYGCGYKLPSLSFSPNPLSTALWFVASFNSLTFDIVTRIRNASTDIAWNVLADLPVPASGVHHNFLVECSARLTLIHRRFAPEWLKLKHLYSELASKEWKHWWAVTEADRLRLRVKIDALCADLYGLDPDDFDWIVRDDPTDPKGFYRVDRQLPFRERLTGLAAAAFRALKEGKWSARAAAALSNDKFFDLLGIPELTDAKAAHAKGLPGPLIEKRDGCHVWKPEDFPKNDPRHGWTWDDCWKDAVALLGSEEAVRAYLSRDQHQTKDPGVNDQDRGKVKRRASSGQKTLFV